MLLVSASAEEFQQRVHLLWLFGCSGVAVVVGGLHGGGVDGSDDVAGAEGVEREDTLAAGAAPENKS